ncbi:MAG TPA: hypothetical protein VIA18_02495, partial [Polyangia bacterium]|nr:hypothetical protein [Polyangia bacterium]
MVARATLAGGAAAVAALFLPATLATLLTALVVTCAVAPPRDWLAAAPALMWAIVAAAGAEMGGRLGGGVTAIAVAAGLARGMTGAARWTSLACGTVGALTAAMVVNALRATDAFVNVPDG